MHTYPLSEYMRFADMGNWQGVADLMLSSAQKVTNAGADFIICPDNTVHQVFDQVIKNSPRPWLHIAEEVAAEASRRGYRCVGVLGTRYLMEGPVYVTKLAGVAIKYVIPEAGERHGIDKLIFDELVRGRFREDSRVYLTKCIARLQEQGCDAVVLGCTELPLLVTEEDSPIPILDSTRLLARAALRKATR